MFVSFLGTSNAPRDWTVKIVKANNTVMKEKNVLITFARGVCTMKIASLIIIVMRTTDAGRAIDKYMNLFK